MAEAAPPPPPMVAILFSTLGGMGDVGKAAVAAAATATPPIPFRAVAVSWDEADDNARPAAPASDSSDDPAAAAAAADPATSVDIAPAAGAAAVTAPLAAAPLVRVNLAAAGGADALAAAVDGATAIVAALSSRQPSYPRWAAAGATATLTAATAAGIRRVVVLSSMGIGADPLPMGPLKLLWGAMLATVFRSVRTDLTAAEAVWAASPADVDYVLFRPMGLTPTEPPRGRGSVKLLAARGEGGLATSVAKADVAAAMLDEALTPTAHRTGVTVGYPTK